MDETRTRPTDNEAGAVATATALVGLIAYAATWALWHGPPVGWEDGLLWTTLLLLGFPLVGVYALTTVEIVHFGWLRGDGERAVKYGLGALAVCLPFTAAAALWPGARAGTPAFPPGIEALAIGQAVAVLAWRAFVLEWFFRGFLLFGLLRRTGATAILVQMVAFALLFWGRPWPVFLGAWPAGFGLGFIAWRCRSFLPGAALHAAVLIVAHLLAVLVSPGVF